MDLHPLFKLLKCSHIVFFVQIPIFIIYLFHSIFKGKRFLKRPNSSIVIKLHGFSASVCMSPCASVPTYLFRSYVLLSPPFCVYVLLSPPAFVCMCFCSHPFVCFYLLLFPPIRDERGAKPPSWGKQKPLVSEASQPSARARIRGPEILVYYNIPQTIIIVTWHYHNGITAKYKMVKGLIFFVCSDMFDLRVAFGDEVFEKHRKIKNRNIWISIAQNFVYSVSSFSAFSILFFRTKFIYIHNWKII
jgi:hypothetical protein